MGCSDYCGNMGNVAYGDIMFIRYERGRVECHKRRKYIMGIKCPMKRDDGSVACYLVLRTVDANRKACQCSM